MSTVFPEHITHADHPVVFSQKDGVGKQQCLDRLQPGEGPEDRDEVSVHDIQLYL